MTADRERRVLLSREASGDLQHIRRWYSQTGAGAVARAKIAHIATVLERLSEAPCSCRRGHYPGTREIVVEGHRLVFRVRPDTGDNETAGDVFVVHIAGPGQLKQGR